jgi:Reverse transcriptase (RNA-dependent DNA polymerase)
MVLIILKRLPQLQNKSIKLVLAIAADGDLELKQLDFDTAFLNAYLTEEVYMEQPEGFHNGDSNMVCKLNKALYGLKQAPYEWNQELHTFMLQLGYSSTICDP